MSNYRQQQTQQPSFDTVFGKVPPSAIPLEEAVLGALMIDREAYAIVEEILSPGAFYLPAHQAIYRAIKFLSDKSMPVDMLTVMDQLQKAKEIEISGGAPYLVELCNKVASAANIEYHARIIVEKHLRRGIIQAGLNAATIGYQDTGDVFEDLAKVEKSVLEINTVHAGKSETIGAISFEVLKLADKAMESKGLTGVPGGIKAVDKQTGGWQDSDLIILAARPGMGKTGFAITQALNAAKAGFPSLMFSLEMSKTQIVQRIAAQVANINVQNIRTGKLTDRDWQDLQPAVESLQNIPFSIDDEAHTLAEIRARSRRAVAKDGVRLIIIDYLQLMSGDDNSGNREQELAKISRGIKRLAKDLNVPIIALSQLSRAVETRGGSKRPILSDLRESGALEQDADAVVFIYRPEYYMILEDECGVSTKGIAEIIFAKHRNGAVGTTDPVGFKSYTTEFFNLDEPQFSPASGPVEVVVQNVINESRPSLEQDLPF